MNLRSLLLLLVSAIAAIEVCPVQGQVSENLPNLKLPTLGGYQFWTDHCVVRKWRIQQNSETGHFRLLDHHNVRQAWGTQHACRRELQAQLDSGKLLPHRGKVVVLLHGLMRTSESMEPMQKHLEKAGFETVNFRYASSRQGVEDHARALGSVIGQLGDQVTEINLVAHSLGNLVIRRYLNDVGKSPAGTLGDPRIRRIVMLGPPNQGSRIARLLKRSILFHTLAGKSGHQLSTTWDRLEPTLATPDGEFGIIAGGQQNVNFSNFVLQGKDDYTVSVDETKLGGASDFWVEPLLHSTMMHQRQVMDATVRFFEKGYFRTDEQRIRLTNPLPAPPQRAMRPASQ